MYQLTLMQDSGVDHLRSTRTTGELRLFEGLGFLLFDTPGQAAGIEREHTDLIGFKGANLADPGHAETSLTMPTALDLDYVAWGG